MIDDLNHNNDLNDINGCDDIDPEPLYIGQYFDLALIKKLDSNKTVYNTGEDVTFVITVYNQGTLDATSVQINDYIPVGLTLNDNQWTVHNGTATLKTPIAAISHGGNASVKITFKIDQGFSGNYIINNAEIESADNALDQADVDSSPNTEDGTVPDTNDNDVDDASGKDDYDPAGIKVKRTAIKSTTKNVTPKPESPVDKNKPCDCDNVTSNKASAMSTLALLLMLVGTLIVATRIFREEELLA
jgi:uncharacterized repeat protein (TIGR01451 family)